MRLSQRVEECPIEGTQFVSSQNKKMLSEQNSIAKGILQQEKSVIFCSTPPTLTTFSHREKPSDLGLRYRLSAVVKKMKSSLVPFPS